MAKKLKKLRTSTKALIERRAAWYRQMRKLSDTINREKREFTPDEKAAWDKADARFEQLDTRIQREKRLLKVEAKVLGTRDDVQRMRRGSDGPQNFEMEGGERSKDEPASPWFVDQAGKRYRGLTNRETIWSRGRFDTEDGSEQQPLNVGRCLRAALTGRLDQLTGAEQRAMFGGTDVAGGFLLNPQLSSRVIDLARSASVAVRAGAVTMPMDSAELTIGRLAADPTAFWRHEGTAVRSSQPSFDRITLRPKMLACIVPVSIELLEDADNAGSLIESSVQNAMGLKVDQAVLLGTGAAAEPKGIRSYADVTAITGVGTPTDYAEVSTAVRNILNANFPGEPSELAWIQHPRDAAKYDSLLDTTNQPLNPTPWAASLKKFYTTSLPTTEGAGTESISIVGHFPQVLIGMRTRLTVRVLELGRVTDADTGETFEAVEQLMKLLVCYLRVDVALIRPTWFNQLTGITP